MQTVRGVERRAKYLLIALRFRHPDRAPRHVGKPAHARRPTRPPRRTIIGTCVWIRGRCCASTIRGASAACIGRESDPLEHPLLAKLAPEPLSDGFDAEYLYRATRKRAVAIKQFIMNSQMVVGVGNIYASESLFRARISPRRARAAHHPRAGRGALLRPSRTCSPKPSRSAARRLRDYVNADGIPGYFRQQLFVYERVEAALPRLQDARKAIRAGPAIDLLVRWPASATGAAPRVGR